MALKYESFTTMHFKTDQVVTVVLDHASLALHTDKNVAIDNVYSYRSNIAKQNWYSHCCLLKTTQVQDYFGIATVPTTLV